MSWLREVSRFIKSLDSTKATGLDKIHVVVCKNLSLELSPILAKLFNHFLKKKCFLGLWKVSAICPVYKNVAECSSSLQYYPISLLRVLSKLFEATINKKVVNDLNSNNLLSDKQYGFHSSKSATDGLTVNMHRISEMLDNKSIMRAITLATYSF